MQQNEQAKAASDTYAAELRAACQLPTPAERRFACDSAHAKYERTCEELGIEPGTPTTTNGEAMTSTTLTTEQPQVHAIAAADASLMRAGLPTHFQMMSDAAATLGTIGAAVPVAQSDTDYLHMQAFNVIIHRRGYSSYLHTVLAKNADWALPTARRELDTHPDLAFYRIDSTVEASPAPAWKLHDWDAMDQRPLVFSDRRKAEDHARFHGHGRFQTDELSRAIFYRKAEQDAPAPAAEAPAVEVDPAWEAQKRAAVDYVQATHCDGSDDEIETDAGNGDTLDEADFSAGEDGVWVRGWLFAPKSALPGYEG